PRDTLGRIRHALETTTRIGQGDRRDRHEQQTILSKGHTIPMDGPGEQGPEVPEPPKPTGVRWRAVLVALLVLVALVLGYGWSDGWFEDPAQWDEAQRVIHVRLLVGSAEQKLADPAQLATVITQLRSAIELAPEHTKAKSMLAQALDTQAQQQAGTDLDAAWVACQEAASLDASNTVVANHLAELRSRLQGRLMAGLTIVEPADGTVLAGPQFVVKGTAPPGVADVTVIVTDERTQRATRQFPARVVAGGFEVVVTAAEVGVTWIRVRATDRHGVEELQLPNIVAVAGVVGAPGTCPDPQGELRPVMTGAGLLFVPIPARRFRMGTPALAIGNFGDEPSHEVVLTAPFWLAESEVTRAQFALVMQATPWRKTGDSDEYTTGPHPATSIDWMMANEFCDRLTTFERKAGRLPEGYRYCLPTEAEWEGAARGGESSMFPHGGGVDLLSEYAVHLAEVSAPAPVKSKKPATPFRLFDMSGNVDEWCADHAEGEDQVSTPSTAQDGIEDPRCEQGENRIVRGGNFGSNPGDCRSAARRALPPTTANETLGFRPALVLR
ncbi:MAG: formylglycine-generating enzyme family protein, partial [Planctomycetota bacterium]